MEEVITNDDLGWVNRSQQRGKNCWPQSKIDSIWKLSEHVVKARCERQVFQFIAEQLENSQSFFNTRNIYEQKELEIQDLVELY